jgi:hypothetical protein
MPGAEGRFFLMACFLLIQITNDLKPFQSHESLLSVMVEEVKMDIQFMLDEDKRSMGIYNNGSFVVDYPLFSTEVDLLKQEGVTDDIGNDLVHRICGQQFLQILRNAIMVVEKDNPDTNKDMLYEFPYEN